MNRHPKRQSANSGKGHPLAASDPDLRKTVELTQAGEKNSREMAEAVGRLDRKCRAIAAAIFRNRDCRSIHCDPEDAVQTFFERWFAVGVERYGHYDPLYPVAYIMLCHICVSMMRADRFGRSGLMEFESADPMDDPQVVAHRRQLAGLTWAALDQVPANWRRALELRYWAGCSAAEGGRALDVPSGRFTAWTYAGRHVVRGELKRRGILGSDL